MLLGDAVARENLGLFDTPPDRREIRIGVVIVGLIYATLLAVFPLLDVRLGVIPGFVPTISAAMLVCDLITAAILYAQAAVFRSRALTALASGYVFGGLLLIPWALTFPGVFAPNGLLGAQINSTGWIAIFWRLSVPCAVILYALLKEADASAGPTTERSPARILLAALVSIALALLVTLLATIGHELLPSFFINQSEVIRSKLMAVNVVTISVTIAAMALLFRQQKSVLDLWLLVSMAAWLAQSLMNLPLHSRYSLGAYMFLGLVFVSNLIVMLALITESNRLYARLALSTAARERERDARLMSMDAVAAAIAHEVGQPLAAAKLSASAALGWLTSSKPDAQKAISSLHETLDSGERTFDVIKSIRASFSNGSGALSEFSLNDLARETVSLLERDLAAQKIMLQLNLDDDLSTVRANRVQIQRVLINLLTNAIDSVGAARRRDRLIRIHTMPARSRGALLEISDSGVGIAPDQAEHVFEPFYTTKSAGMGLGLSLSRTIVEQHGGRLWVSQEDGRGATFHLQLPPRASREA